MARHKRDLGLCRCGCGRPADMPKHLINRVCYGSIRVWSNARRPEEREAYRGKLTNRLARLALIDQKLVVIGTSPYKWRVKKGSNVIRLNLKARQRGSVR